jgi:hypothetical protein
MQRSPWSSSPTSSDMRAFTRPRPIARLMTSTRHDRRRRRRSGCSVSRTTARVNGENSKRTSLRESSCCRAQKRAVGTSRNASAPPQLPMACSYRRTLCASSFSTPSCFRTPRHLSLSQRGAG